MASNGSNKNNTDKPVNYYSNIHHHFDRDELSIFTTTQKTAIKQILQAVQADCQTLPQNLFGTVIDIGCGTGNMLAMLIERFKFDYIYGVDLSAEMLEIAKAKIPDIIAICDSAVDVQKHFPKPIANLLVSHFLFAYEDYRKLMAKFSNIAVSGSLLSICSTTSNTFAKTKNNVIKKLSRTLSVIKWLFKIDGASAMAEYSEFMPKDLASIQTAIEQRGYKILNAESISFTITLKTWRDVWEFFHDAAWFVGVMQQYKISKFKVFCIFHLLKIAGLFKHSNDVFQDDMEIVVITAKKI